MNPMTDSEILSKGLLRKWQAEVILSKVRTKTVVASRQIGKTLALRAIVYKEALERPGIEILMLATSLKQSRALHFRPMCLGNDPIFEKHLVKDVNKTDMILELKNGSRVYFASTEAATKLRGYTCSIAIIDEAAFTPLDEVLAIIQPILAAREGRLIMVSTPNGKANAFYSYYQRGLLNSPLKAPGFRSWRIPISEADVPNKEDRIRQAKSILSPEQYAQEYECSFDSVSGLVYKDFDPVLNSSRLELDTAKPLWIGVDFNVNPMSAVVGQRIVTQHGDKTVECLHILDEIVLNNSNTQQLALEISRRYSPWKDRIWIYADASGQQRHSSSTTGVTDNAILRTCGRLNTVKSNPKITDRVNNVTAKICNAAGDRQLFIHERCRNLVLCLSSQTYDSNGKPDKKLGFDHLPDALGYLVSALYPITHEFSLVSYG